MKIKVLVRNLRAYSAGQYVEKWITLPMDMKQLEKQMQLLCHYGEDYAIHDYDATFHIDEFTNIYRLNEQLSILEEYELSEDEAKALIWANDSLDEAIEKLEEGRITFYHLGEYDRWEDLAEMLVREYGYMDVPERLQDYLEYEVIGRELAYSGEWDLYKGVAVHTRRPEQQEV